MREIRQYIATDDFDGTSNWSSAQGVFLRLQSEHLVISWWSSLLYQTMNIIRVEITVQVSSAITRAHIVAYNSINSNNNDFQTFRTTTAAAAAAASQYSHALLPQKVVESRRSQENSLVQRKPNSPRRKVSHTPAPPFAAQVFSLSLSPTPAAIYSW